MLLAAATTSTAPWWGSGVFTLLGGVVAGVLTQLFNAWNTKRKARADQQDADRAMRREALFELMTTGHKFVAADSNSDLAEARAHFFALDVQARLIFEGQPLQRVKDFANATWAYMHALDKDPGSGPDSDTVGRLADTENALVAAARKDYDLFGLPAPSISTKPS